jgi:hypothetical protein
MKVWGSVVSTSVGSMLRFCYNLGFGFFKIFKIKETPVLGSSKRFSKLNSVWDFCKKNLKNRWDSSKNWQRSDNSGCILGPVF